MKGLELTILPRASAEGSALEAEEKAAAAAAAEELQQTSPSLEGFERTAWSLLSTRIWRIWTVRSCWLILAIFGVIRTALHTMGQDYWAL